MEAAQTLLGHRAGEYADTAPLNRIITYSRSQPYMQKSTQQSSFKSVQHAVPSRLAGSNSRSSAHPCCLDWYQPHACMPPPCLPHAQFVREFAKLGLTRSVGGVMALALARELTPVVTAIILAGRVGSAFAAELGTMQVCGGGDL